jgi:DNA-binding GntR family transcriptional regulator
MSKRPPPEVDPLRSATAYEQLKIDIVACLLKPGDQITEGELQERYQLGKATLRAALARLSQDGLVRSEPRRGYRITPITLRDVNEIFDARIVLEPVVLKLGTLAMTRHGLEALEPAIRQTRKPETIRSPTAFLAASKELRLAIARTAGNFRLVRMLGQLLDESERVLHLGYLYADLTKVLSRQQDRLLAAVRKADAESVEAESTEQIVETRKVLLDALVASESFLSLHLHALPAARRSSAPGQ